MNRLNLIERRVAQFLREPPSVRGAAGVIVTATVVVVVGAGVLISVIDPEEYPDVGIGIWWALQTVTTVGYGDVAPTQLGGRLVAAAVMLQGITFIAIITAVITSTFVARATRQQEAASGGRAERPGAHGGALRRALARSSTCSWQGASAPRPDRLRRPATSPAPGRSPRPRGRAARAGRWRRARSRSRGPCRAIVAPPSPRRPPWARPPSGSTRSR